MQRSEMNIQSSLNVHNTRFPNLVYAVYEEGNRGRAHDLANERHAHTCISALSFAACQKTLEVTIKDVILI